MSGLSPVESSGGSAKASDPTDTHSEASSASPQRSDAAEDLSMGKNKAPAQGWSDSGGLEAKCGECGCLFETQDMLKVHVQETHVFQAGDGPAHPFLLHPSLQMKRETGLETTAERAEEGQTGAEAGDAEAYCAICNKHFVSHLFLASHRAAKHPNTLNLPHSNHNDQEEQGDQATTNNNLTANSSNGDKCTLPTVPGIDEKRCAYCGETAESAGALAAHVASAHLAPPVSMAGGSLPSLPGGLSALYAAQLLGAGLLGPDAKMEADSLSPSVLALMALSGDPSGMGKPEELDAYLRALQAPLSGAPDISALLNAALPASPGQGPPSNGGVVNPEAYCEICRKEFCNKYFLRTHKAKKHGIIMEDSPGSLKRGRGSFSSGTGGSPAGHEFAAHTSVIQSLFSGQPPPTSMNAEEPPTKRLEMERNTAATPPATTALQSAGTPGKDSPAFPCGLCGKTFPQYLGLVTHQYQDHGDLSLTGPNNPNLPGPPTSNGNAPNTPTKQNDPEAFCELCQKEFCSKYFLRQHKANIHGIRESPDGTPTPPATAVSPLKRATPVSAATAFPFNTVQRPIPPGLFGNKDQHLLFGQPQLPPSMVHHGLPTTPNGQAPPQPKPRYSTGKNFCDICNKEVCNKYFLRTHMLKMHGIVIDEHKTVIGNINTLDKEKTGTLIFRCDICSKEMRTREALKQHKQEQHGVLPRSIPAQAPPLQQQQQQQQHQGPPQMPKAPSSASTAILPTSLHKPPGVPTPPATTTLLLCPFCETKAPTVKLLQIHVLKECPQRVLLQPKGPASYRSSIPPPSHFSNHSDNSSPTLSHNSEMSSEASSGMKCEFCDERFADLVQRQLHIFAAHSTQFQASLASLSSGFLPQPAPSAGSATSEGAPPSVGDTLESEGERSQKSLDEAMKTYQCELCPYATKWASNLAVHARRHEEGNGAALEEEKPHPCSVCARSYSSPRALQRHMDSHRRASSHPALALKYASPQKDHQADQGKRFRCTQCHKVFKSRDLCRNHLVNAHRRTPTKTIQKLEAEWMEEVEEKTESGWGEAAEATGRPHVVQMFRAETEDGVFGPLNLFLPVPAPLASPLSLSLTLTPLPPTQSRIRTL